MCVVAENMKTDNITVFIERIRGVMVSVIASSAVDRGFEPRSGQTKEYNIGICCFSAKHAILRRKRQRLVGSESG